MDPTPERLTMYGRSSEVEALQWTWVDEQLRAAGVYWIVTPGGAQPLPSGTSGQPHPNGTSANQHPSGTSRHPHPRPVWGVWDDGLLYLSVGSPRLNADLTSEGPVTVHLGGDVDVVIVEGASTGASDAATIIEQYNAKYDWDYVIEEYGPFRVVTPSKVIAWRSAGWAGRDGFQSTGRWRFPAPEA